MTMTHSSHSVAAVVLVLASFACTHETPLPAAQGESPLITAAGGRTTLANPNMHPRCMEHFAAFDDNGDGRVSQDEFNARPHAEPEPAEVFRGRDTDGDGSLTENEFCSSWRGSGEPASSSGPNKMSSAGMGPGSGNAMGHRRMGGPMMGMRCEQHFEAFDVNRDGKLTKDEFITWPHLRGDAETIFGERDRNHDGSITSDEFCAR
ncbi:MAG TPA: EF-hand domain-containing protein [Polyangiaceae bacterium]|nr:EF-hand domain-containing protein [Polyangiaceae bacterium]